MKNNLSPLRSQKTLLKISLCFSFILVFILLVMQNFLEPKIISIKQAKQEKINSMLKIQGQVESIYEKNNLYTLTLKDKTDEIKVSIFSKDKIANLTEKILTVTGRLTEYNNNLQLQAYKLSLENDS